MKLNQQWNFQIMFSSVHDVHLCLWLIRPTPLKREMSKDQLGFIVWMTACSLRLSFTSSIASGLAPRSSAVRQTRALFSLFFLMNYLQICMQPCNLPDLFISWLSSFFRSLNRLFPYMMSKTFVVARQVLVPRWCFCWWWTPGAVDCDFPFMVDLILLLLVPCRIFTWKLVV